jgi:endonuclease/exonuclease/phosphatase family metal-dependent hydrolase
MPELKILTLNLWSEKIDVEERLESLAKIIMAEQIDIVAFQESSTIKGKSFGMVLLGLLGYSYLVEDLNSESHGCGIISNVPILKSFSTPLASTDRSSVSGIIEFCDKFILVTSTHLSWGLNHEPVRFKQVQELDKKITEYINSKNLGDNIEIALLAGDFNAEEFNDCVRYLRGELGQFQLETAWTDLYTSIHSDSGVTSSLYNKYAIVTARNLGLDTSLNMPERRIDYIFSRGYAYGKPGTCKDIKVIKGSDYGYNEPSDHYGILANIIV